MRYYATESRWQSWQLLAACLAIFCCRVTTQPPAHAETIESEHADVVVVGGTPGGLMAAIAAAREGKSAIILERSKHIGGLPANGLGATDISTRGATGGLFMKFVRRNLKHYRDTYGDKSSQVRDCRGGYHFEPSVAEQTFHAMLAEFDNRITVKRMRQFDADSVHVRLDASNRLTEITILNRETGAPERYRAKVFIDATYEGDLAAAAGAPYRLGRESKAEFNEPRSGRLYAYYERSYVGSKPGLGSTGQGDNAIQAYNYRLCLTDDPENGVPIQKPATYVRHEYVSLLDDIRTDRRTQAPGAIFTPRDWNGMGRVVSLNPLPNSKTDGNHQASGFLSTDLAEENWPWPTSSWQWRDRYAQRLRDYILGLLWFIQHDEQVPASIRANALKWRLAANEYKDNGNFPRQPYVREGRRVMGEFLFTAHDALPADGIRGQLRPPIHPTSITASHYHLDSHATRKREDGRIALEGFFSLKGTAPYTVPLGVIVPKTIDGLLTPVPVSATHIGFSTLRMEPCWMAMGEAAGLAAALAIESDRPVREVDIVELQKRLIRHGAVLIYFRDVAPGDPHYDALQFFALRGFFSQKSWNARLNEPVTERVANKWLQHALQESLPRIEFGTTTRGDLLDAMYAAVLKLPHDRRRQIRGDQPVGPAARNGTPASSKEHSP